MKRQFVARIERSEIREQPGRQLRTSDFLSAQPELRLPIDLGPKGGDGGGEIVAQGAPEEVVTVARSYTGRFLKPVLGRRKTGVAAAE